MKVQTFDTFKHWGNLKEYQFMGVALPNYLKNLPRFKSITALHTEESEQIQIDHWEGVYFSLKSEYLVLYKNADGELFARPIDNFFEHVDGKTRRFTKI